MSQSPHTSDGSSLPSGSSPGRRRRVTVHSILWPLVLSLAVLGVIGYFTFDPSTFQDLIRTLNPWWLVAAAGTVVLRVLFGAWRLHYVSHGRLDLVGSLRGQLAWDFFSNVTPSTIGGGPIAAAFIAKDRRLPAGEAASIMLFAILLDQVWFSLSIPIILIAGLYVEIIPASLGAVGAWSFTLYFLVLMGWVLVFGYFTLYRPHILEKIIDRVFRLRLLRRFRARASTVMSELRHRARVLRAQRFSFYLNGFLLTLATWLLRYLLIVCIIWSVYPALDVVLISLRTMALTLGSLIMPTPGGAGGLEGLYALFFGPPVMPQAFVVPTLLTWRLLGYYVFIALGTFLTMHQVQQTIRRKHHDDSVNGQGDGLPEAPVLPTSMNKKG